MQPIIILEAISTIAGGQRVLLDLMPALKTVFNVTVIVPGPGPLTDALCDMHVATTTLPIPRYSLVTKSPKDMLAFAVSTPRLALLLGTLLRRTGADLVYANSAPTFPWGTLGAALARRPIVWHSHNNLGDGKSLLLARLLASLPTVKRIVGASSSSITQFKQPTKSMVIRSGVDLEHFSPSESVRRSFRSNLAIRPETPLIGLLGDFIPLKRQDVFLRAAQRVQTLHPEARFVIVGSVRPNPESLLYRQSIELLLGQVNIIVLRWPDDIPSLIVALDLLVIASTTETGPLVLFQALACGVPVISTPVGHAVAFLNQGAAGELYPVDDVEALATVLLKWLDTPEKHSEMKLAARKIAVTELDIKSTQNSVIKTLSAECHGSS
jgi:glycosyltransferase involved in cell wall biosynthesis